MPNKRDSEVATPEVEESPSDTKATKEAEKGQHAEDVTSGTEPVAIEESSAEINGLEHEEAAVQAKSKLPKGRKRKSGAKSSPPKEKRQSSGTPGRTSSRLKNQASGTKLSQEISSDNLPKLNRRRSQAASEEKPSEVAAS